MKEKEENSYSEDYSIKELNVTNNNIDKIRRVIDSKDYVRIHISKLESIYINMNISSYYTIIKMSEDYPEQNICFLINRTEFFTPNNSFHFSKSCNF